MSFSPRDAINSALDSAHPATVKELFQVLPSEMRISDSDFVETVKEMVSEGSLVLDKPNYMPNSFLDYLRSPTISAWLWASLIFVGVATTLSLTISAESEISFVRWIVGSALVLYMPGYAVLKLLLPRGSEFGEVERVAMRVGLSIVVVVLIGLVLNFSPWGIHFSPVLTSLTVFTCFMEVVAAYREYTAYRRDRRITAS